jgi:hypothetical protein
MDGWMDGLIDRSRWIQGQSKSIHRSINRSHRSLRRIDPPSSSPKQAVEYVVSTVMAELEEEAAAEGEEAEEGEEEENETGETAGGGGISGPEDVFGVLQVCLVYMYVRGWCMHACRGGGACRQ